MATHRPGGGIAWSATGPVGLAWLPDRSASTPPKPRESDHGDGSQLPASKVGHHGASALVGRAGCRFAADLRGGRRGVRRLADWLDLPRLGDPRQARGRRHRPARSGTGGVDHRSGRPRGRALRPGAPAGRLTATGYRDLPDAALLLWQRHVPARRGPAVRPVPPARGQRADPRLPRLRDERGKGGGSGLPGNRRGGVHPPGNGPGDRPEADHRGGVVARRGGGDRPRRAASGGGFGDVLHIHEHDGDGKAVVPLPPGAAPAPPPVRQPRQNWQGRLPIANRPRPSRPDHPVRDGRPTRPSRPGTADARHDR